MSATSANSKQQNRAKRPGKMAGLALLHVGDAIPAQISLAIVEWFFDAAGTTATDAPSCVCCDTLFGPRRGSPKAFVAFFSDDMETVIVAGVCRDCDARGEDAVLGEAVEQLGDIIKINRVIRPCDMHPAGHA